MDNWKNRLCNVILSCALLSAGATYSHTSPQSQASKTSFTNNVSPVLVHRAEPIYPDDARKARVAGTVVLNIIIGTDGSVQSLKVVSGPRLLVPAAALAVRQWRYKPLVVNGKPGAVDTNVNVVFNLDQTTTRPAMLLWNSNDASVFYRELEDAVLISIQVPDGISPIIFADPNDTRLPDNDIGMVYGVMGTDLTLPCSSYLNASDPKKITMTNCGTRVSGASLAVKPAENDAGSRFDWIIPKSELSPTGRDATFFLDTYDAATHQHKQFPSDGFSGAFHVDFVGAKAAAANTSADAEPLHWLAVVTQVAKGVPARDIISELQQHRIDFDFNVPLDPLHEEMVRSLGGTDELMQAFREAQLFRSWQEPDFEKLQLATAEKDVRKLLAKAPENAYLHFLLATIALRTALANNETLSEPRRAAAKSEILSELRKAIALNPQSAFCHFFLGQWLLAPETVDEAVSHFQESLRFLPNQFESHMGLAVAQRIKGDPDRALAEYEQILRGAPHKELASAVHEWIGDLYLNQKKYDLTIAEYRTAASLVPEDQETHLHFAIGTALATKGDFANAVVQFREYLWPGNAPWSTNAHLWLAGSLYQLKRYNEAASEARLVLAEKPDDQQAQNWLKNAIAAQNPSR